MIPPNFGGNTGKVSEELWVGLHWGESLLCTLSSAWTEWKGLKFYSPLWFHPFGWKRRGIAGGSQCACHKITGNVWLEPWVGLRWVKQSAPLGWVENSKKKLQLYCTCIASWDEMIEREPWRLFKLIFWLQKMCHRISGVRETEFFFFNVCGLNPIKAFHGHKHLTPL